MATVATGSNVRCLDGTSAFNFNCQGPNCYRLAIFPDSECTQNTDSSQVNCTNNIPCSGGELYSSSFVFEQAEDGTVSRLHSYSVGNTTYALSIDGIGQSIETNITDLSTTLPQLDTSSTSTSTARRMSSPFSWWNQLLIAIFIGSFFIPSAEASNHGSNHNLHSQYFRSFNDTAVSNEKHDDHNLYARLSQSESHPLETVSIQHINILIARESAWETWYKRIYEFVDKFEQIQKDLTLSATKDCPTKPGPNKDWYKDLFNQAVSAGCEVFVSEKIDDLDAVLKYLPTKTKLVGLISGYCAEKTAAKILQMFISGALVEVTPVAFPLAVTLLSSTVCDEITDLFIEGGNDALVKGICNAIDTNLNKLKSLWPTSSKPRPSKPDQAILAGAPGQCEPQLLSNTKIKPAKPPSEIYPSTTRSSTTTKNAAATSSAAPASSNSDFCGGQSFGASDSIWNQLCAYPCTACSFFNDAFDPSYPSWQAKPYGENLSPYLCSSANVGLEDNDMVLCNEICAAPCDWHMDGSGDFARFLFDKYSWCSDNCPITNYMGSCKVRTKKCT